MRFKIPLTFSDVDVLKKRSRFVSSRLRYKKESKLGMLLKNAGISLTREEYLGICIRSFMLSFLFLFFVSTTIFFIMDLKFFYFFAFLFSLIFSFFVFFSQTVYPSVYTSRKQREIEKNLISALEDIHVQLNSGVSLFNIMVNISDSDYGELSQEFKKVVRRINAGEPESDVLNDIGKNNPSLFFRRTLWQISNGLNSGSDMAIVIKESIKSLNEEQMIQIQNYGNKLNPLIMFYMIASVIMPSLSVAFLTIIASMVGLSADITKIIFYSIFVIVGLIQFMFLGIIKSKRPSLI